MAGAGKKTFTAGEVLTASDVNTYLMEQSVMYFAGTAARSSAIPTPSTGMTSYIGVTGTASIPQIETYTGSAWQTPYGLTLLNNTTFTSTSAIQIDNVFSSAFDDYKIVFRLTACSSSGTGIRATLVDGTTPTTTAKAFWGSGGSTSGGSNASTFGASLTYFELMYGGSTSPSLTNAVIDLVAPNIATSTGVTFNSFNLSGGSSFAYAGAGAFETNDTFEGIRFAPASGTMSGVVKIYGYRK